MDVKEKLVELIAKAKEIYAGDYTDHTEDEYIAEMLLDNGVTVQEWIPVTERLPEDDLPKDTDRKQIRCLVATDKGTVKPCVRQRYQTKKNGQWCFSPWEWNKDLFAKPTHWMPLPKPPKGD